MRYARGRPGRRAGKGGRKTGLVGSRRQAADRRYDEEKIDGSRGMGRKGKAIALMQDVNYHTGRHQKQGEKSLEEKFFVTVYRVRADSGGFVILKERGKDKEYPGRAYLGVRGSSRSR